MPSDKPKSLKSVVLNQLSELSALSEKAVEHQTLRDRVCKILPESMHSHIVAVDLNGDKLTVVCDSASWATRIRFYSQNLIQNLVVDHKSTDIVNDVVVKVRPHWHPN